VFNQQINNFLLNIIIQTENNVLELENKVLEEIKYITNGLSCLKGYFSTNNQNQQPINKIVNVNVKQGEEIMTFTKRKDGRWTKTLTINNVKKYIYGKTKKECYEKFIAFKKDNKTILTNAYKSYYKIKDWLIYWYEMFKKPFVSISTQKEIENIIDVKLEYFHNIGLSQLKTETLQQYFNKITKSRSKEKTILYFKASLDKAVGLGKIKLNPFNAFIKDKKITKSRPPFTYNEQEKILNRLENEEIKIGIILYLITGVRKEELNFKTIENDIDIENKMLKAINLKQQQDDPPYKYIDLTDNAIKLIMENLNIIHSLKQEKIYRKFKEILKELNIKGGIHTLRHTFATNHLYLKTPIKVISTWLGHSTTQITQDIYLSLEKNITAEKINKLYNNLYVNF